MASKFFRIGKKQVFLPDHTVTMLRPRENQPPTFASFQVPLTFNKLDMRDYLLHAYNVPVLRVRSQLTQRRPERSDVHHRIYRPPPIKTMTVELHKPFVYPAVPDDLSAWNPDHLQKRYKEAEDREKWRENVQKTGMLPLREEHGASDGQRIVKKAAQKLLEEGFWENGRKLDPKFTEGKKGD